MKREIKFDKFYLRKTMEDLCAIFFYFSYFLCSAEAEAFLLCLCLGQILKCIEWLFTLRSHGGLQGLALEMGSKWFKVGKRLPCLGRF